MLIGDNRGVPHVAALYRYPIKGLAPEQTESLLVEPGGRIAGDRVLAFRHTNATEPEEYDGLAYRPKSGGLCIGSITSEMGTDGGVEISVGDPVELLD